MTTGLVGQHQLAPFASPQPGQPLDATVVLGNDNSTVNTYDAHDNDSTIHFQSSALADRPPASTLGQKWLTTDANARFIYYDNGSAWVEVDYFRDTGGIITGAVTISDTTESTSTTTGALIVSGGVGIAKNVFIGGTLGVTGVATFTAQPIVSTLTASLPVFSDGSKGLVSNAMTGTGNVVMSASPTLTGTIGAASMTLSGTLGVTGVATLTAQPILSSLTASKPVFTDASKGLVSTGTLGTDQGGTNLTTYTTGDILYASATNVLSKLPIGTTGQHLIVSGGIPSWSTDSALGTVTSVSWTGGLVSVATATTTPALTVAGTSGGIVYFSSASTWASSAALTANAIVLGGGAGAAPATTTTGTGVVTALGVNVGTAGAFVVNGGALGTPSSGAVAASLITAGTFGAGAYTFPGALAITGAFTGATTGAFSGATSGRTLSLTQGSGASTGIYATPSSSNVFDFAQSSAGTWRWLNAAADQVNFSISDVGAIAVRGAATFSSTVSMGALTATTGAFSGQVTLSATDSALQRIGTTTNACYQEWRNTSGYLQMGVERSVGGGLITGSTGYAGAITTVGTVLQLGGNQTLALTLTGAAAQFSSTITAATVYTTTVGATNRDLYIDNTGLIGYVSSIRASKTNITPLTDTSWLDALTPVAFNYRKKDEDGAYTDEANTTLEYGLIAEEVEGINPELVFYDETKDGLALRGVSYNKLMIPLLQRIQTLTARVAALEAV